MTPPPSSEFGQYQLLEKIAQGGMAEIFRGRARDAQGIEKPVVIKRILPHIAASPEFIEMLIDEAKIAVMLSHGNIAQIYDLGKVADDYFIVMEYVDGKTLSQTMKRLKTLNKRMPVPFALWIAAEVAKALDYMHRKTDEEGNPLHIVHRDISPQNIILSTSGTVKIIDFGIAKAKTKVSTTDSGVLKGKFAYMSPEHAEGERLDWRTDTFSLGIILFELLTGERLFKGKDNDETIKKVKKAKTPSPSSLRKEIDKDLDRIVLTALQKDRERRFQSASEFSDEVTRHCVTHYPNFSPRELIPYLAEIFPEVACRMPARALSATGTDTKGETDRDSETREETAAASSQVIRKNIDAAQAYLPFEPPPAIEEKGEEEKTSSLHLTRLLRPSAVIVGGILLIALLVKVVPRLRPLYFALASRLQTTETVPPEIRRNPIVREPPSRPIPNGSLSLDSEPTGATIFLNDEKTEWKTPAQITVPPGREHKVGLYIDRHRFWEGRFQVDPGKTISLSVPLELNFGELEVRSAPPGAQVLLNGGPVGKTPLTLSEIPPETTFNVLLRLEGYEEWGGQVKVFGGKKEVVDAGLKRTQKPKSLP